MASKAITQGNLTPAINYTKIILIVGGLMLFIVGCGVGLVIWYNNTYSQSTTEKASEIASTYVPDDYFSMPKEEKNSITVINNGVPTGVIAAVEESKESEKATEIAHSVKEIKVYPPPLTAEEAFLKKQLNLLEEMEKLRKQRMLERKDAVVSSAWQESELVEVLASNKNEELKDKDFSQHEIDKDISTFPVDLTRTITADRYIPCILNDQINSQLAGRATCTVESNVFGVHGRLILIPAGSRLIGQHGTLEQVGDERFNINWTRLIRPDGVHIKLTDAYASDRIGSTGVEGVVNNRRWEKYGAAILTATVSAIAQISIPTNGTNISNTVIESYGTDLGRVTAAMLEETINIKPYSIVPAGTRVLVTPMTDIWLKAADSSLSFEVVNNDN